MEKFKVTSTTKVNNLAGAIAGVIRQGDETIEISAVGAGAVNQTVKAIAVARGFLISSGIDIVMVPSFKETILDGETRTVMVLEVKKA